MTSMTGAWDTQSVLKLPVLINPRVHLCVIECSAANDRTTTWFLRQFFESLDATILSVPEPTQTGSQSGTVTQSEILCTLQ